MTKDEALDLALEALDDLLYWDNGKPEYDQARKAITAIKQARSAPVQEPVALVIDGVLVKSSLPEKYTGHLYTTPPAAQRQWVGLTDEEIDKTPCELYAPDQGGMTVEEGLELYARAIEAKLRSKNEY